MRVSRSTLARASRMRESWRSKPPASLADLTGRNGPPTPATLISVALALFEAEIDQHAADAPRLVFKTFSSSELSVRPWRCSTRSSEACRRASLSSKLPADLARPGGQLIQQDGLRGLEQEGALVAGRLDRRGARGVAFLAGRLDRAGRRRVGQAADRRGARFERRLALQDLLELLFVQLLIEQLPAGDAVDLRPQLGDAVLVAELHVGLSRNEPGQDVVAEGEIGARGDGPQRHDHQRADHHPEGDRAEPHLPPGMREGVVAPRASGCGCGCAG